MSIDGISLLEGILVGAAIAAPTTYLITVHWKKLNSAIAFYEGKEAALKEFRVERVVTPRVEGRIWKDYFVVISERLLLQERPVSPFWEHKIPVNQELDTRAITELTNCLANVADKLLGITGLRKMVLDFMTDLARSRAGALNKKQ